jgi:hypothetical protein
MNPGLDYFGALDIDDPPLDITECVLPLSLKEQRIGDRFNELLVFRIFARFFV